jgi:hypothetical protein
MNDMVLNKQIKPLPSWCSQCPGGERLRADPSQTSPSTNKDNDRLAMSVFKEILTTAW